jgi:hypothetical protein
MAEEKQPRGSESQTFTEFLTARARGEDRLRTVRLRGRLLTSAADDRFIIAPWGGRFVLEARTGDVVDFAELEGADRDLVEIELRPEADVRQVRISSAEEVESLLGDAWTEPSVNWGYAAWKEPPGQWGYAAWKDAGQWGAYAAWKEPPGQWGYAAWKDAGQWGAYAAWKEPPGQWGYAAWKDAGQWGDARSWW